MEDKLTVDVNDILIVQNEFKVTGKQLVQEQVPNNLIEQQDIHQDIEQWIQNVFMNFSSVIHTDDYDGQGLLNGTEPLNERLKQTVVEKEQELNSLIDEIVVIRTENPSILNNLISEVCQSHSQYTQEVQILPPSTQMEVEEQDQIPTISIDELKNEYKDSVQLIGYLTEVIPAKVNTIDRVNKILSELYE